MNLLIKTTTTLPRLVGIRTLLLDKPHKRVQIARLVFLYKSCKNTFGRLLNIGMQDKLLKENLYRK